MAICPATFAACIDDICCGSGCLKLQGEPMLTVCEGCGSTVAIDGSDKGDCQCWMDDELDQCMDTDEDDE